MSKLSQFYQSSDERTKQIGEVESFVSKTDGSSTYNNNQFVKVSGIYNQADYPDLFNQIGFIGAANWTPRTSGTSTNLVSLAYGNSKYIASGPSGSLFSSSDGITWAPITIGTTLNINSIDFVNSQYVIAGNSGLVGYSSDGNSWEFFPRFINTGTATTYNKGVFANGRYVVVGLSGTIKTSTDGITWSTPSSGTSEPLYDVTYGAGKYVAVGGNGYVAVSTDASTWTASQKASYTLNAVTYGNGVFLMGGNVDPATTYGILFSSTDAATWTSRTAQTGTIFSLEYLNANYLLGADSGIIKRSTDGVTWNFGFTLPETITSGTTSNINQIIYGNGIYVYVTNGTSGNNLRTSTDGITWTARSIGVTATVFSVTYGNGLFVIGTNGGGIRTSTDGITWTGRTSGTSSDIRKVTYGNSGFVYVGVNGAYGISTDAVNWDYSPRVGSIGVTNSVRAVVYGTGTYVVGATGGVIRSTTDTFTWTAETSGTSSVINALTFGYDSSIGQNTFLYGGDGGVLGRRLAGTTTWSAVSSFTTSSINTLTYKNSWFVFGGNDGVLGFSSNGTDWNTYPKNITTGTSSNILSLAYGNGYYLYGTTQSLFYSQTNPGSWSNTNVTGISTMKGLTYASGVYLAGGASGKLLRSTNATTWSDVSSFTTQNINGLAYGRHDSYYMFVGNSGILGFSSNGTDWNTSPKTLSSIAATNLVKSAYGNGIYLVAGSNNTLYSSTNLSTWSSTSSFFTSTTIGLTYGNQSSSRTNKFVATSASGSIRYSSDGVTWTTATSHSNQNLDYAAFDTSGLDRFLVASNTGALGTSTDAITWDMYPQSPDFTQTTNSIAYGNGIFVAVGENGSMYKSFDNGKRWQLAAPEWPGLASMKTVFYSNGLFFIAGNSGQMLRSSDNTNNWEYILTGTSSTITSIGYGNGRYFYGGTGGAFGYSLDNGNYWIVYPSGSSGTTTRLTSVVYGNGIFVTVGDNGTVRRGLNPSTWTTQTVTGTATELRSVTYGNGLFVIGGRTGVIHTSTDAITWYSSESRTLKNINVVNYVNGRYFFGAENGVMGTSTDAIDWDTFPEEPVSHGIGPIVASAYGNGTYVIFGSNAAVRTSTNGITWTTRSFGVSATINSVAYGNGYFIAVGNSGVARRSTDGITWSALTTGTSSNIFAVAYGASKFLIGGQNATLLQSTDDGSSWSSLNSGTTAPWDIHGIAYSASNGTWIHVGSTGLFTAPNNNLNSWTYRTFTGSLDFPQGNDQGNVNTAPYRRNVYDVPGTYSWVAPNNASHRVRNVNVVCIGGGGGGFWGVGQGGGGGGLGWFNNYSVTPGSSYTVFVGAGGAAGTSGSQNGSNGGSSYFVNTSTVVGGGGVGGTATSVSLGGGYIGQGGGNGGNSGDYSSGASGGAGGAGGYTGTGGKGGTGWNSGESGSGGGGGGGGAGNGAGGATASGSGGGGGTSPYAAGSNGFGGYGGGCCGPGGGGGGGSGGGSSDGIGGTGSPRNGGQYGGGGGSGGIERFAGSGNRGCVLIYYKTELNSVVANPNNSEVVAAGKYGIVTYSNDYSTWNQGTGRYNGTWPIAEPVNTDLRTITYDPINARYFVGGNNSIGVISSNFTTWNLIKNTGTTSTIISSVAGNSRIIYGTVAGTTLRIQRGFVGANTFLDINSIEYGANKYFISGVPTTYSANNGNLLGAVPVSRGSGAHLFSTTTHNPTTVTNEWTSLNLPNSSAYTATLVTNYTTPGTYSWTCPAGVFSVDVVAIGGGGGGFWGTGQGGGGGGLGWARGIAVRPTSSYTVFVGAGGAAGTSGSQNGGNGTISYFGATDIDHPFGIVAGGGGGGGTATGVSVVGGFQGDGGGFGGASGDYSSGTSGGGGGAGGYSGNGGKGGTSWNSGESGSGGGGGGGGAGSGAGGATASGSGGGGGTGTYGFNGTTGGGGSGGGCCGPGGGGGAGSSGLPGVGGTGAPRNGGLHGGGGGSGGIEGFAGKGGDGAVSLRFNYPINKLRYTGGRFLLSGTRADIQSGDGTNWTLVPSGHTLGSTTTAIRDFAYNNGLYYYAATTGKISTSTDSFTWVDRPTNTTTDLNAITFGNNSVVAVGNTGVMRVVSDNFFGSGLTTDINSVTYEAGYYFYAGNGGTVGRSTDVKNWTALTSGTSSNLRKIKSYSGNTIVIAGDNGVYRYSTDWGSSWTTISTGFTSTIRDILIDPNNYYYIVGDGLFAFSSNGLAGSYNNITNTIGLATGTANAVVYGNGAFVFGGQSGLSRPQSINNYFFGSGTSSRIVSYVVGNNRDLFATENIVYWKNYSTSNWNFWQEGVRLPENSGFPVPQSLFFSIGTENVDYVRYTSPGVYSWVAPAGVTKVSVVCVGGGGGASSTDGSGGSGGGGGGLGWKNDIAVTPGSSYQVVVGLGGAKATVVNGAASAGGTSYFINTSTVAGFGGGGSTNGTSGASGGGYVGDGGGNGGSSPACNDVNSATGGGGAGGYTGNGGNAGAPFNSGSSGSGGGGGGGAAGGSNDMGGPGGGVGILGQGSNGAGGSYGGSDGNPGGGGSGGNQGSYFPSTGGLYGGGGGGAEFFSEAGPGASGAVAILYNRGVTNLKIKKLYYSDGVYNVIGTQGKIAWSTDAQNWYLGTTNTTEDFLDVNKINTEFRAVGANGVYRASSISQGTFSTWSTLNSGTTTTLNSIIYGNGRIVYFGNNGYYNFSEGGFEGAGTANNLNAICSGWPYTSTWVAVGDNGTIRYSTNRTTWSTPSYNYHSGVNIRSIVFTTNTGRFIFVGDGGAIGYANYYDLNYWYQMTSPTSNTLNSVTFDENTGTLWASGNNGTLIRSTDSGNSWTLVPTGTAQNLNAVTDNEGGTTVFAGNSGTLNFITNSFVGSGTTQKINSVTIGGYYVAVGNAGLITSSNDRINWTVRTSGTSSNINAVHYSDWDGYYVYVGDNGTIGYSTDGVNWTNVPSATTGVTANLRTVTTINGNWFAFGDGGVVYRAYYSNLYSTWTALTSGTSSPIYGSVYANNRFIYGGFGGMFGSSRSIDFRGFSTNTLTTVFYSNGRYLVGEQNGQTWYTTDNINWTQGTNFSSEIEDFAYGNGLYLVATAQGAVHTSGSGYGSWTSRTTSTSAFMSVGYGNGIYFAGANNGIVRTSTDGVNWFNKTSQTVSSINTVVYNNSFWWYAGNGGFIRRSTNNFADAQTPYAIKSITFGNGNYVIVSETNAEIVTSTDLASWTRRYSSSWSARDAVYGNGRFYVIGGGGNLVSSSNLSTWENYNSGSSIEYYGMIYNTGTYLYFGNNTTLGFVRNNNFGIKQSTSLFTTAFGNGVYITAGSGGLYYTSSNLIDWTTQTNLSGSQITKIIFANGRFVLGDANGNIRHSTNGTTWTLGVNVGSGISITDIEYGQGRYIVAFSSPSLLYTSTDGVTWSPVSGFFNYFNSIKYSNGTFIAVGSQGAFASSDGLTWTNSFSGTSSEMRGVEFGTSRWTAVGNSGTVVTTENPYLVAYSPTYSVSTQFFVPNITTGTITTPGYTSQNTIYQNVYVKAKI